jgi:hypothetical protein
MLAVAAGSHLVSSWAKLYSDQKAVSAAVTYLHFVGILMGGGFAVVADRTALRLSPDRDADWLAELTRLATVHRWVIAGLAVSAASGVLMMLADLHTYTTSVVFWTKMGLIVVLIGNGWMKLRAEAEVRGATGGGSGASGGGWRRLRRTAVTSLVLWLVILLAGTILNASA